MRVCSVCLVLSVIVLVCVRVDLDARNDRTVLVTERSLQGSSRAVPFHSVYRRRAALRRERVVPSPLECGWSYHNVYDTNAPSRDRRTRGLHATAAVDVAPRCAPVARSACTGESTHRDEFDSESCANSAVRHRATRTRRARCDASARAVRMSRCGVCVLTLGGGALEERPLVHDDDARGTTGATRCTPEHVCAWVFRGCSVCARLRMLLQVCASGTRALHSPRWATVDDDVWRCDDDDTHPTDTRPMIHCSCGTYS